MSEYTLRPRSRPGATESGLPSTVARTNWSGEYIESSERFSPATKRSGVNGPITICGRPVGGRGVVEVDREVGVRSRWSRCRWA